MWLWAFISTCMGAWNISGYFERFFILAIFWIFFNYCIGEWWVNIKLFYCSDEDNQNLSQPGEDKSTNLLSSDVQTPITPSLQIGKSPPTVPRLQLQLTDKEVSISNELVAPELMIQPPSPLISPSHGPSFQSQKVCRLFSECGCLSFTEVHRPWGLCLHPNLDLRIWPYLWW